MYTLVVSSFACPSIAWLKTYVGAALQHQRRHRVSEEVARPRLPDPGLLDVVAHDGGQVVAV